MNQKQVDVICLEVLQRSSNKLFVVGLCFVVRLRNCWDRREEKVAKPVFFYLSFVPFDLELTELCRDENIFAFQIMLAQKSFECIAKILLIAVEMGRVEKTISG